MTKRCLVIFEPAVITAGCEIPLDRIKIDVTEHVLEMGEDKALQIRDCSTVSDNLVEGLHDHNGPFSVLCEDAISEFFDEK